MLVPSKGASHPVHGFPKIHLLFAAATTGYILIALQLEERDLVHHFGEQYQAYRRKTSMLLPRMPKK